jgi:hypothetical protein
MGGPPCEDKGRDPHLRNWEKLEKAFHPGPRGNQPCSHLTVRLLASGTERPPLPCVSAHRHYTASAFFWTGGSMQAAVTSTVTRSPHLAPEGTKRVCRLNVKSTSICPCGLEGLLTTTFSYGLGKGGCSLRSCFRLRAAAHTWDFVETSHIGVGLQLPGAECRTPQAGWLPALAVATGHIAENPAPLLLCGPT